MRHDLPEEGESSVGVIRRGLPGHSLRRSLGTVGVVARLLHCLHNLFSMTSLLSKNVSIFSYLVVQAYEKRYRI